MSFYPRRTLARALIVSLLAHVGLLFGVVRILPGHVDAPAVLVLRVVAMNRAVSGTTPLPAPAAAVEAPTQPHPAPAVAAEAPPLPNPVPAAVVEVVAHGEAPVSSRVRKVVSKKLVIPDSRPKEIAVPAAPSIPVVSEVSEAEVTASAAPQGNIESSRGDVARASAPTVPSGTTSSGAGFGRRDGVDGVGGVGGVSADDVRQYRLALRANARRFKRYPPLARERGWEGTVEITLDFRHSGVEPVLSITGSSGKTILDEQALETLRQAVRQTELPEGLKGRDFRMPQEISFSLENE